MITSRALRENRASQLACGVFCLLAPISAGYAAPGDTTVVGAGAWTQGAHTVSADGRFVLIERTGLGLVVADRETGTIDRVDVSSNGTPANYGAANWALSTDGRYAAFISAANNLSPNDTNGAWDVYVRDRQTKVTEIISADATGAAVGGDAPAISADGRFVAFTSASSRLVAGDTNNRWDTFVRDRMLGVTVRVSVDSAGAEANEASFSAGISSDGRYVTMGSYATNLIADDTNGQSDVFVHDRLLKTTERASVDASGAQRAGASYGGDISGDGRFITVSGQYSWPIFLYDRVLHRSEVISVGPEGHANGRSYTASVNFNGQYVAFTSEATNLVPGDNNGRYDVFVRDRLNKTTERVSVNSAGVEANQGGDLPSISADGRFVIFNSSSTNLAPDGVRGVFIHERGVPAFNFTVNPRAITFGNQAVNTSTQLSFWLRNKGSAPLPVTDVSLVGLNRTMFSVDSRCGSSVAPASDCAIRVTFRPTAIGAMAARLRIVAGENQLRLRDLTGTGVVSSFTVLPTALSFGAVPVNSTPLAKVVTVTHAGSAPLSIASIDLGGANANLFSLNHNCPASLLPGGGCTISVAFSPSATGSFSALVNITPGEGAATRSVALVGAGR